MSALDARIRRLAREELNAGGSTTAAASPDRLDELEKEVADLRARLEKLETAATPAKRTARKTSESGEGS